MSFQNVTKNLGSIISKNTPSILTGVAVAGVISVAVSAGKDTYKAMSILEQERLKILVNFDGPKEEIVFDTKEKIKLTYKCYIPTAILAAITIGCLIGSNKENLRRNAALASMYSLSELALKEYQSKVVETLGANKEQGIRDAVIKDKLEKNPSATRDIIITGKGNTLCYDVLSGQYFESDIETIRQTINEFNRNMLSEMFMSLNDLYYELGLNSIKMGDYMGWHVDDGLLDVTFSAQVSSDGRPCLVLDYSIEPRYSHVE